MKIRVVTGWITLGMLAIACGPSSPPETIGHVSGGTGTGGRGGGSGTSIGSTGAGGFGSTGVGGTPTGTGVGGSIIPPGGAGGTAGAAGAGPASKAGPYREAVVESEEPPPPIAGGTLAIIGQGTRAAIADPDHDQVVVADIEQMSIVSIIPLLRGDDPGRIVEDGYGRLHVALRGGRAVAVLDPTSSAVVGRLPVCVHPRGLAYEAATDSIHVACMGGELVSYNASSGIPVRKLRLERDLRDVVVDGPRLLVSRFRAAELLMVESDGTMSGKLRPPLPPPTPTPTGSVAPIPRIAAVAWRTIASPDGGALMVYQLLGNSLVQTTPGGYGGGSCGGIITTAVSVLRADGSTATVDNVAAVLPVDIATNDIREAAVVSAAWTPGTPTLFGPFTVVVPPLPTPTHPRVGIGCSKGTPPPPPPPPANLTSEVVPQGRVVAIGYGPQRQIVLQTREPATLIVGERVLALPGKSRKHTGHELFHLGTLGGLACASCHPEGREDGQVWTFAGFGQRRTQSINGGIRGTEPFHWSGDMGTFSTLAHDVFNSRMTGPLLTDAHVESMFRWIDQLPRLAPPTADDPAAVERGRAVFNDANVGCATCHSGEKMTNNATVNVGTGSSFQVPSLLGLAWRAPYMHQGCAGELATRFESCGGGDAHGHTSQLTAQQGADLIAYLDSL